MEKRGGLRRSFGYAFRGIGYAIQTQRNMRIHLCAAFYVNCAGLALRLPAAEWAAVLLCIALVISLELMNTAIEHACDSITKDYSEEIGRAKDCAAGAVLWAAMLSAGIGCVIFVPRLLALRTFTPGLKMLIGVMALTLPLWLYFIFKGRKHK